MTSPDTHASLSSSRHMPPPPQIVRFNLINSNDNVSATDNTIESTKLIVVGVNMKRNNAIKRSHSSEYTRKKQINSYLKNDFTCFNLSLSCPCLYNIKHLQNINNKPSPCKDEMTFELNKYNFSSRKSLLSANNNNNSGFLLPLNNSNSLKLPSNNLGSFSKLSLNGLNTPAGSIYDVSDTNSIVFKNNIDSDMNKQNEDPELELQQSLNRLKLSQLDEQIATNYKLKCKNWLQSLIIDTPT